MSPVSNTLLAQQKDSFLKSLKHLDVSFQKVKNLSADISDLNEEQLETWESFSVRLARSADIFLSRLMRTMVLYDDPGFIGSFRDFLNRADKLEIVADTEAWLKIRALRNVVVHDYQDSDLEKF